MLCTSSMMTASPAMKRSQKGGYPLMGMRTCESSDLLARSLSIEEGEMVAVAQQQVKLRHSRPHL